MPAPLLPPSLPAVEGPPGVVRSHLPTKASRLPRTDKQAFPLSDPSLDLSSAIVTLGLELAVVPSGGSLPSSVASAVSSPGLSSVGAPGSSSLIFPSPLPRLPPYGKHVLSSPSLAEQLESGTVLPLRK